MLDRDIVDGVYSNGSSSDGWHGEQMRKSFGNLHSIITILNVPGGQINRGAWVGLDGAKGGRGGQRCGRWVNKSKVQHSSVENYSNIAVLLFDEKDSKVVTLVTSIASPQDCGKKVQG